MSNIITSKQGVVYYDYNDVKSTSDIVSGRRYYKKSVSNFNTYRTKSPVYVIKVYWDSYEEVEFIISNNNFTTVTKQSIDVDELFNILNETTGETLNGYTTEQVQDYIDQFNQITDTYTGDEFINMTGHLEATEEDLVDTGFLTLFNESNIVTEDMFQVSIKDDVYTQGAPVDTESIMRETKALEDTTTLMSASVPDAEDNNAIVSTQPEERTTKNTFEAAVGIAAAVNDFGQFLIRGSRCPVCGKVVQFMPSNGYCSLECAGKDLLRKLTECLTGEYEVETPEIIEKIKNILDYFNLALNVITKIPDVLASLAKLPQEYKNYATAKLNLVFLEIKKIINKLLIKKNELIIKLLRRIKFGTIDDKLSGAFAVINQVIKAVQTAKLALESALQVAYTAITKANGLFYIGPQEYGFFMTLKSNLALCPFYKTDPLVYPPEQLGRPFWGAGTMNIAFDMSLCQFSASIGGKSALQNVDFKKINKIIRKVFLPITTPEYLMDPDLFDVRLALSDQNAPAIQKLTKILEYTIVIGGDFIPSYERLSLINIWFVVAILTCWGPWTRAIYGDFIFHAAL